MAPLTHKPADRKGDRHPLVRMWPHLVAAYVAYHIVSILVAAIPGLDGAMDRQSWKDPTVQNEFSAWANRLDGLGIEMDAARLEDVAWRFAETWIACRRVLMTPFYAYQRTVGAEQSWSMFVAPHRHPSRLCIDIRQEGGQWQSVYIARSDEDVWRRDQFDHIRFRSAVFRYAWPQYKTVFENLAAWIATQVQEDFSEADQVRVRFFRFTTLSPEQIREGDIEKGEYTGMVTISLGDLP